MTKFQPTMDTSYKILLLGVLLPSLVFCDCPNELPEGDCAMVFWDAGCEGAHLNVLYGEEVADLRDLHWGDKISSLVVREGCTYTGYRDKEFMGDHIDFQGIHLNLKQDDFGDEISSHT